MEIEHRAHHCADVSENMNETGVRKQLTQAANEKRIFWSPIYPSCLRIRRRTCTLKPTHLKARELTLGLALSFQVVAMRKNQIVDALPQCGEQFVLANIHGAQDRAVPASRANLVSHGHIDREVSHPIGLWHGENVWMLTQTPSENACS